MNGVLNAQTSKIEELKRITRIPYVAPENIITDRFESLGKIVASHRNQRYLSNDDIVYLQMNKPVSVGDRFSVYADRGKVKVPGSWLQSKGRKIQILGYVLVTEVSSNWVTAKIYDAKEDIMRGNEIGPLVDFSLAINPQEPKSMIRGRILSAAKNSHMIGSYEFAFIDKGKADGLQINDRLYVYRSGDSFKNINSNLPEIPVAELVVVQLDEHVGTVYTLNSHESFEAGAAFKSAISEVKYLDEGLQGLSEDRPQIQ